MGVYPPPHRLSRGFRWVSKQFCNYSCDHYNMPIQAEIGYSYSIQGTNRSIYGTSYLRYYTILGAKNGVIEGEPMPLGPLVTQFVKLSFFASWNQCPTTPNNINSQLPQPPITAKNVQRHTKRHPPYPTMPTNTTAPAHFRKGTKQASTHH